MAGRLVLSVAGWLQLEAGVLDVEVPHKTALEVVEQSWGVAVAEAAVVDDKVG